MKHRALPVLFLLAVVATTCLAAADVNIGTWKLNETQSQIPAGATKHRTIVFAPVGENVRVTTDGVDANGKPIHTEWTGKYDGNAYPLSGDPDADARTYSRISDHTLALTETKSGRVTRTGRIDISPDGKTRRVMTAELDAKGIKGSTFLLYEKQ